MPAMRPVEPARTAAPAAARSVEPACPGTVSLAAARSGPHSGVPAAALTGSNRNCHRGNISAVFFIVYKVLREKVFSGACMTLSEPCRQIICGIILSERVRGYER